MGDLVAAAKRRPARFFAGAGLAQGVPHLGLQRQVKIGQHHGALRQIGHGAQQPRNRRRGRGDPGSDHRMGRRIGAPRLRRMGQQQVAPHRGIHLPARIQFELPAHLHPREQAQAVLPVLGQFGQHVDRQQLLGADLFGGQPIERLGQAARLAQQACLAPHDAQRGQFLAQDLGQAQQAQHRIAGRWRHGSAAKGIEQRAERLVQIEIAHHRHARQQQPATRGTDECLGQVAHRALAGQQQRQPGQAERVFAVARDQSRDQRIGKSPVRGNGIDAGPGGAGHQYCVSAAWVGAIISGAPTSYHRPVCGRP